MPSLMIHLLTAYKYNPNASVAFWIGNIAPDSVSDWKEKDKTHFRDRLDRLDALRELAFTMNLCDDFSKGILLHLYLDYYWDSYPMRNFIENYKEGNWFPIYRNETALAGGWLFHHTQWSKTVWDEMIAYPILEHENSHGIVKENVADFINRNNKWHVENNIGPSSVFTPDFIEEFTSKVAIDFKNWLENI
ncbi:MAG TPA: hypothetical protein VIK78_10570 [Ruminiclostridium sp.]